MLTFTMSEDGLRASIGPCVGGFVRLSILRLCRELAMEIPAETLDETTRVDELRALNLELLIQRGQQRRAQSDEALARQARERAERERRLSPEIVAQVAALRERAQSVRTTAQYADDYGAYRQELAQAQRLEHEAEALLAG
jgi:Zn-dependent M32 family carboxypeptidase